MNTGEEIVFTGISVSRHAAERYRQRINPAINPAKAELKILRDIFTCPAWHYLKHGGIGATVGTRTYVMRKDANAIGAWVVTTVWDAHTKRKVVKRERRKGS